MINKIEGFIAAPLTGYHPDGTVNLDVVPRYAQMLHADGIVGVFVNGTTGEGLSLTIEDRRAIAGQWVEAAPDGLRVIIHVGHTCQAESQALAAHAAEIGAYAIGEIGPVFFRPPTVEALVDYVAATAASAPDLPYYYYHMPSMNNVLFPMIDFLRLGEQAIPNLSGIKYTHDDTDDYRTCREFQDEKFDLLFGRDEYLVDGLHAGARGAVGSTYNFMAPLYHELVKSFRSGDLDNAQRLQAISAETCRILYATGSFGSGLKAMLRKIGIDLGDMRRPQTNLSPETVTGLESSLLEAGTFKFLNKG